MTEVIEEPIIDTPEEIQDEVIQEPEEEKVPKGVQKRIDKMAWEKGEAKREAERERARAIQLELELERFQRNQPREEPKVFPNGAPDPNKYAAGQYDPEYIAAKIDYTVSQRIQEQQATAVLQQKGQTVAQLEAQAKESYPDYEEAASVMLNHGLARVPQFREILLDADNPAKLTYYLGKNPDELEKISSMTPNQALRYIGKLEAKISDTPSPAPATKPVTSAPKPIAPLGSAKPSGIAEKDPEKMTMAEYAAWRAKAAK